MRGIWLLGFVGSFIESIDLNQNGDVGMKRKLPPPAWILIAMVIGIVIGYMIFVNFPDKKVAAQIAGYISIMSDVFLRLIKMLIGPQDKRHGNVSCMRLHRSAVSVPRRAHPSLGWVEGLYPCIRAEAAA
jgi:hypothetical protein